MINISQIKSAMLAVNGWKQSLIANAPVIDDTNKATTTDTYYQDFSSLVTVDNIINVYETQNLTDEQVNTLLTEIVYSAADNVMNAVFGDDDFIENNILYPYEYDFQHTLENDTSFVGYQIDVSKDKDIINIVNRISLTFDGIDNVKILLFHSSKKDAVDSIDVTTATDSEVNKELTDWFLPYANSVNGGTWYIGYLRSGLTAKAYNRNYNNSIFKNTMLNSCWKPIKVSGHDTETLFDINLIDYEYDTWGINFDISAFKNYNSIIARNKNKFSKAMGLQVAAKVLDMIANNNRSNRIERNTKDNAVIQLNGFVSENVKTVGILARLTKEIENLKDTFLNIPNIQTHTLK